MDARPDNIPNGYSGWASSTSRIRWSQTGLSGATSNRYAAPGMRSSFNYHGCLRWACAPTTGAGAIRALRGSGKIHTFTNEEDIEKYKKAWSQPGAMTAMINWYRAGRYQARPPRQMQIKIPTLMTVGHEGCGTQPQDGASQHRSLQRWKADLLSRCYPLGAA